MIAIHSHVDGDELVIRAREVGRGEELATMRLPSSASFEDIAEAFQVAVFGRILVRGIEGAT